MNSKRWNRAIENMKEHGIDEVIISSPSNIFYFTGIWINVGERMAVLHINIKGEKVLIINEMFEGVVKNIGIPVKLFSDSDDPVEILSNYIGYDKKVGIDKNWPAHFLIELIEKRKDMKFVNSSSILDELRMIKDGEEIDKLKKASNVADMVVAELIPNIHEGITEKQMADKVGELFAKHGAHRLSFEPIIAFGANCADPHHEVDDTKFKKGDMVTMDIGGVNDDYCSDITRTVFTDAPFDEEKKIYNTVLKANLTAISIIKPGIKFSDVDKAARDVITEAGYGKYFLHRTGHNIGIEDHEPPSVSSNNDMVLEPGMVFSIEPGIYIAGKCGVRIEDLVAVTQSGVEVLNKSPKELKVV